MRYGNVLSVPRAIPKGRVLVHNHVRHGEDWPCGPNGFRWWTWPREKKPRKFLRCECGWMGLPHFATRDHAKRFKCSAFKPETGGIPKRYADLGEAGLARPV